MQLSTTHKSLECTIREFTQVYYTCILVYVFQFICSFAFTCRPEEHCSGSRGPAVAVAVAVVGTVAVAGTVVGMCL